MTSDKMSDVPVVSVEVGDVKILSECDKLKMCKRSEHRAVLLEPLGPHECL